MQIPRWSCNNYVKLGELIFRLRCEERAILGVQIVAAPVQEGESLRRAVVIPVPPCAASRWDRSPNAMHAPPFQLIR